MEHFFAPCPRGLEAVLEGELRNLGANGVSVTAGGVHFSGPFELCYRANLESRIASRVLWRIAQGLYRSEDDIYGVARALDWKQWFGAEQTIRVDVAAFRSPVKSLNFVTLRLKDAICDRFMSDLGRRPSVDTEHPQVRVYAFLSSNELTLYLDTSGEPLFKRGWRSATVVAPLRENLAAGILRLTGWTPGEPLLDPMCGSGTLLIEAALIACDMAPGLRRGFAFERLKNFNRENWGALRQSVAARAIAPTSAQIFGSDLYGDQLAIARANVEHAGLSACVELKQANVLELPAPAPNGVLVANLPYGLRMGASEQLGEFYPKLGTALKQRYAGWRAYLFSADRELAKRIRLKATKRTPLFNGALDCRLYEYKLVAGSARAGIAT